jgi:predicted DsbA family dithiol-disulfide isomerase
MSLSKNLTVTVAHDYICPWCWVGFFHAKQLLVDFPQITLDWKGYELLPVGRFAPPSFTPKPHDPNRAPSRFELFAQSEGVAFNPARTIGFVYSHNALEGAEYAKTFGKEAFENYNEGVYRAYWEKSLDISNVDFLADIAHEAGIGREDFITAVTQKRFNELIVPFDDEAYAEDITHVPTFRFRGERVAEAPYAIIKNLTERFLIWNDKS